MPRSRVVWSGLLLPLLAAPPLDAQDSRPVGEAPAVENPRVEELTVEQRLAALEAREAQRAREALALSFRDGLRLESADRQFELRIGGRMQLDALFGDADDDAVATVGADLDDGTQMRRGRLALQGRLWHHFDFKWEYDFADKDGKSKVMDAWAGIVGAGARPNLRVGHFREPFGHEALTGSSDLLFMERALPFAFVPFRNVGLQAQQAALDEQVTWAAGLFRETNDSAFGQADGAWAVTARVTGLAWCTAKKDHLVHLGLSASRRAPPGDEVQYRSKPEANLAPDWVDTTKLTDVDRVLLSGVEAAVLLDRFSLQGEWVAAEVQRSAGHDDAELGGWYAQAAWTLTGEPRRYDGAAGVLRSPKPARSLFAEGGGFGAWELAVRRSTLDFDDGAVAGGQLEDLTLGLNWYVNPVTRIALNAIRADLDGAPPNGSGNLLELRVHLGF